MNAVDWVVKYRRCYRLEPFLEALYLQEERVQRDLIEGLDVLVCVREMGINL